MTDAALATLRREVKYLPPGLKALAIARSGLLPAPTRLPDGSLSVPSLSGREPSVVYPDGRCDCNAEYNGTDCWHKNAVDAFDLVRVEKRRAEMREAADIGASLGGGKSRLFHEEVSA